MHLRCAGCALSRLAVAAIRGRSARERGTRTPSRDRRMVRDTCGGRAVSSENEGSGRRLAAVEGAEVPVGWSIAHHKCNVLGLQAFGLSKAIGWVMSAQTVAALTGSSRTDLPQLDPVPEVHRAGNRPLDILLLSLAKVVLNFVAERDELGTSGGACRGPSSCAHVGCTKLTLSFLAHVGS